MMAVIEKVCARKGCGQKFFPFMPNRQIYCSRRCERIANGNWLPGRERAVREDSQRGLDRRHVGVVA